MVKESWITYVIAWCLGCLVSGIHFHKNQEEEWNCCPDNLDKPLPCCYIIDMNYGKNAYQKRSRDNLVRYHMTLWSHPGEKMRSADYTLNGSVKGFGDGRDLRQNGDLGPYDLQYWLKNILPQRIKETLIFDSESCEFYVYSDEIDSLEYIVNLLDGVIHKYDRLEQDRNKMEEVIFLRPELGVLDYRDYDPHTAYVDEYLTDKEVR